MIAGIASGTRWPEQWGQTKKRSGSNYFWTCQIKCGPIFQRTAYHNLFLAKKARINLAFKWIIITGFCSSLKNSI